MYHGSLSASVLIDNEGSPSHSVKVGSFSNLDSQDLVPLSPSLDGFDETMSAMTLCEIGP